MQKVSHMICKYEMKYSLDILIFKYWRPNTVNFGWFIHIDELKKVYTLYIIEAIPPIAIWNWDDISSTYGVCTSFFRLFAGIYN